MEQITKKYLVGYFTVAGIQGSAVFTSTEPVSHKLIKQWNELLSEKHSIKISIFTFNELADDVVAEGFENRGDTEEHYIKQHEEALQREYYERLGKATEKAFNYAPNFDHKYNALFLGYVQENRDYAFFNVDDLLKWAESEE